MVEHSSFDIGYTCNYKVVSLHDSKFKHPTRPTLSKHGAGVCQDEWREGGKVEFRFDQYISEPECPTFALSKIGTFSYKLKI